MISVSECAAHAGLASNELVLGAVPSEKHRSLLSSYLLNSHRGLEAVRVMIVADLRSFLDLGVPARAADLLIVLRMLLTEHPQACRPVRPAVRRVAPLEAVFAVDLDDFDHGREAAVVLSFARGSRRIEPRGYPDRLADPAIVRRNSRPFYLRGDG
jgi:hypothetical protein